MGRLFTETKAEYEELIALFYNTSPEMKDALDQMGAYLKENPEATPKDNRRELV